ncbi:MAG: thiamine pyrophosphate-requiring protein [Pseudomonadota bacterium]
MAGAFVPKADKSARAESMTAGGVLLARLKALGVDYIFANSGTDFPPIIEGLAEASADDIDLPEALVMPHESAAMGMAHGYYLATGRPQAVMAHTNVGLANCAIGAINAAAESVPILLFSGRTPILEKGRLGARSVPIGWGQEMRDQTALVREACKWDYELRYPEQAIDLVDRAHGIALSTPPGPVYISLPREPLSDVCPADGLDSPPTMAPAVAAPQASDIAKVAKILAKADRPVIIAQHGAGSVEGFETLTRLVNEWAIPVCHYWALQVAISTDDPMYVGRDPEPWISEADAVVILDSLAPWSPEIHQPAPDCPVIQIGPDPLHSRFPIRNFRADLSILSGTAPAIAALAKALEPLAAAHQTKCEVRREKIMDRSDAIRARMEGVATAGSGTPLTKAWASHCLSQSLSDHGPSTVITELGCPLDFLSRTEHNSFQLAPHSGGLGWGFPCALGIQLADRERIVVATLGDGSYLFSNPAVCHQIAEALDLPVLVLILNNAEWRAVRQSVLEIYPDGHASKANQMPMTSLAPHPDFVKIAEASRAWARRVAKGPDLPGVLAAAIEHVQSKRTQALVEVVLGD